MASGREPGAAVHQQAGDGERKHTVRIAQHEQRGGNRGRAGTEAPPGAEHGRLQPGAVSQQFVATQPVPVRHLRTPGEQGLRPALGRPQVRQRLGHSAQGAGYPRLGFGALDHDQGGHAGLTGADSVGS